MSPFETHSYTEIFKNNLIGGNAGNLLFTQSISRALMTENVAIDYLNTNRVFEDEDVEWINSVYDAFIIPLANAFRVTFIDELKRLTELIRRLKIPAVVIGVGLKGGKIGVERVSYPFDEEVKDFCAAVLEKSGIIGLRGDVTARYLENLGFRGSSDFTVIGCPSMYLYGENLPEPKELNLSESSRINLNCKASLPKKIHLYLKKICESIPDHYYIAQNLYEFETVLLGRNLLEITNRLTETAETYPKDFSHILYRENRVRGFASAKMWMDFLAEGDLSFGTRIHGNIAGVLAGVPGYIVAPDSRVFELARYHNIPHTTIKELDASKSIFELLDGVDFSSVKKGHSERFNHYLDFLHINNLETIFGNPKNTECKFDRLLQAVELKSPLMPYIYLPYAEQLEAIKVWDWLISFERDKIEFLKQERENLREENSALRNDFNHLKRRSLYYMARSLCSKTYRRLKPVKKEEQ